jgi:DNA-binding NtrC family response regulator
MRFLIVDESAQARRELAAMLNARWPEARCEEWDPRAQGDPREQLARGGYAAVLLDSEPGGADGIAWVAAIRRNPDAPPVVLLTARGGEYLAVKAISPGRFHAKDTLDAERLVRSVEEALTEQEANA